MELEPEMLATETIVPVYFALEDEELLSIYTQTLTSSPTQGSSTAAEGVHVLDRAHSRSKKYLSVGETGVFFCRVA